MASFNKVAPVLQSEKVHSDDFYYDLPEEFIAQNPAEPRDSSQLLIMDADSDSKEVARFIEIGQFLKTGDVIVVNNSKVYPAKYDAIKKETGDSIEVFLLRELEPDVWEVQVTSPRKVRIGNTIKFAEDLVCDVIDNTVSSGRVIQFQKSPDNIKERLYDIGKMPIPPYIDREATSRDEEFYQSIFAKNTGSIAAPSAALHFSKDLVNELQSKGIIFAELTIHLNLEGYETVTLSEIDKYSMNSEYYEIPVETSTMINDGLDSGHKIIAAGASVVRALMSSHFKGEKIIPKTGWTDLFIYPPYSFHLIDGLITNFHHAQSPTLFLQSAFLGREKTLDAYQYALERNFRFQAFGDAMLMFN